MTVPIVPETQLLLGHLVPPGPVVAWESVDYSYGSPATGGLYRLRGDGWTWFCKVLHHVRHWPALAFMPGHLADEFAALYPWRSELEMWDEPWVSTVPDGLRVPELHAIVELGDDRVAVWMEDIREAPASYELDRFTRAAGLLGRWNARTSVPELVGLSPYAPGYALRMYAEKAVVFGGLTALADDGLWSHPWLAEHADLRVELRRLGGQIPSMLDRLDTFTQALPHGDASPQNLLVPADDPATFVVIDVSFRTPHALGFDLGQLLVGLVHAGLIPASRLPEIAAGIVPAYLDGLAAEGIVVSPAEVRDAFATSVLLRSGFDGFRFDLIGSEAPGDRQTFDERIALSRFLVDQYDRREAPV